MVNVAGACARTILNNAATPNPIANFITRIIARFSSKKTIHQSKSKLHVPAENAKWSRVESLCGWIRRIHELPDCEDRNTIVSPKLLQMAISADNRVGPARYRTLQHTIVIGIFLND